MTRLFILLSLLASTSLQVHGSGLAFDYIRGVSPALSIPTALKDNPARPELPRPSVDHAPQDVVRIVIDALAHNDDPFPDAGIETTFGFASPANRVNTGPLEKFTLMVKAAPYGVMVDHVASDISDVVMVGEDAYLLVILTTRAGDEAAFAFRLSQQTEGKFRGMWMTDAVWPITKPVENLPGA